MHSRFHEGSCYCALHSAHHPLARPSSMRRKHTVEVIGHDREGMHQKTVTPRQRADRLRSDLRLLSRQPHGWILQGPLCRADLSTVEGTMRNAPFAVCPIRTRLSERTQVLCPDLLRPASALVVGKPETVHREDDVEANDARAPGHSTVEPCAK